MFQLACGVDLIEVTRFEKFYQRNNDVLCETIFTAQEYATTEHKAAPLLSLAARFAAKEAVLKLFAIETALYQLDFIDIEVLNDPYGKPYVVINEKLQALMQQYNFHSLALSLSHTAQFAVAFAVAG